jgi:nitroreductase
MAHARHGSFLSKAKAVVAVTVTTEAKVDAWLAEHDQPVLAGACAIQNMWLAAWDLGLGACWVTLDRATTRKALSIPSTMRILGSLALGYPTAEELAKPRKERRALAEMLSFETFGEKEATHS